MAKNLIEFRLKHNGDSEINFDGEPFELLAGVLTLTKCIHQSILLNGNEYDAEWFRETMGRAMVCPDHPLYKEVWE